MFLVMQIRHGRCGTPQVFEVERQQDVRSPVYYRLERVQDSKQMSGYIHLKEFNARAKRDILTGVLLFIPLSVHF
jgi:carboxyl-terminal processing protease